MDIIKFETVTFQKSVIDLMNKFYLQEMVRAKQDFRDRIGKLSTSQKNKLIESVMNQIPLPTILIDISNPGQWRIVEGEIIILLGIFMVQEKFPFESKMFPQLNGLYFGQFPIEDKKLLQNRIVTIIAIDSDDEDLIESFKNQMLALQF